MCLEAGRKATAEAVPLCVDASLCAGGLSHLLTKRCALSTVKAANIISSKESHIQFMRGALFARICAEAKALRAVFM